MSIKAGDRMPSGTFKSVTPDGSDLTTDELFRGKSVLLFGVPGAFTPTCSGQHLPGFIENAAALAAKGISAIACIAVNDVFVMKAWGKSAGADGKVLMLADGNGDYTRALGLELDARAYGMGMRSKRFAIIVRDGIASVVNVEQPGELKVSTAEHVLTQL